MKDGFIKVAAITPKLRVADVQYNIGEIKKWIKEAEVRVAEHWYNNMSEERPELAIFNLLMKIY